jgi:hypothetical protein
VPETRTLSSTGGGFCCKGGHARRSESPLGSIDNLTRAPDPIAFLTTARGAVGRRQMSTAACECDEPARSPQW